MDVREQRQHQRFQVADQNIHAEIAFAKILKILDISIGGALLQTDTRLNISKEYTMRIEHNSKFYSIKGSIVWSVLKECKNDQQGNNIPIYRSGMQFLHVPEEFKDIIFSIGTTQKQQVDNTSRREKHVSQSVDISDMLSKGGKHLETYLSLVEGN